MSARWKEPGTPGPWFVDRRADGDINVLEILARDPEEGPSGRGNGVEHVTVAQVASDDEITDIERADARTIAAAPDGYALARQVVRYFGSDPIPPALDGDIALRDAARALIAKVES